MTNYGNSSEKDFIQWIKENHNKYGTGFRNTHNLSSVNKIVNRRKWSEPGKDDRDPQLISDTFQLFIKRHNWSSKLAEAKIFTNWESIVGKNNANHSYPVHLENGVLSVVAASTSWASQLRLEQKNLLSEIAKEVGTGVVCQLSITGPTSPSWKKGSKYISGRGPRDTYG